MKMFILALALFVGCSLGNSNFQGGQNSLNRFYSSDLVNRDSAIAEPRNNYAPPNQNNGRDEVVQAPRNSYQSPRQSNDRPSNPRSSYNAPSQRQNEDLRIVSEQENNVRNSNSYTAPTETRSAFAGEEREQYSNQRENTEYENDELSRSEGEIEALALNIPGGGVPGEDYPILSSVPETDFSCDNQEFPGYYADTNEEAGCQVFHICHGQAGEKLQMDSFLCPNGTIFNQQYFVCDWWFNVDCTESEQFFELNQRIGEVPENQDTYGTESADQRNQETYEAQSDFSAANQRNQDSYSDLRNQQQEQKSSYYN